MIVVNFPIEPLEERYSIQWDKWFTKGFYDADCTVIHIVGDKTSGEIKTGSFLDVLETNQYKVSQLQKFLQMVPKLQASGETIVLFFQDLWFPGLSTIAYIRDGLQFKDLKITGCLHAGSYDEHDYLNKMGMTKWAAGIEAHWFGQIADQIYVATEFHKKLIIRKRKVTANNIKVTGFPIFNNTLIPNDFKEDIVVFPHRLDGEKQPFRFKHVEQFLGAGYPQWKWVTTKDHAKTKAEYYVLLQRSKIAVSFALQETWGIAMQEAVMAGCIPICPNRLSYAEMYEPDFLYDTEEEGINLIRHYMNNPVDRHLLERQQKSILTKGKKAIPNIITHLKQLGNG